MENLRKQLKQGDIIMHHAHGWLSTIIRTYDQSHYNHCSIYDKDGFLYECINGGITRKTIEESIKDQKTSLITIFRTKNADQKKMQCLINTIKSYPKNTYAYSQILLLASILWKRKQNLTGILGKIANVFFLVFEKIIFLFVDKKNANMICSELIYRAYMDVAKETKDIGFSIHIPLECNPLFVFENEELQKLYPCELERYDENNASGITNKNDNSESSTQIEKIQAYLSDLFSTEKYHTLSFVKYSPYDNNTDMLAKKAKNVARILKRAQLYNFITPGDIARSLDTYVVATYKTDLINNFTNCPVCNN